MVVAHVHSSWHVFFKEAETQRTAGRAELDLEALRVGLSQFHIYGARTHFYF